MSFVSDQLTYKRQDIPADGKFAASPPSPFTPTVLSACSKVSVIYLLRHTLLTTSCSTTDVLVQSVNSGQKILDTERWPAV